MRPSLTREKHSDGQWGKTVTETDKESQIGERVTKMGRNWGRTKFSLALGFENILGQKEGRERKVYMALDFQNQG